MLKRSSSVKDGCGSTAEDILEQKENDGTDWLVGKGDLRLESSEYWGTWDTTRDWAFPTSGTQCLAAHWSYFCSEEFHGLAIVYIAGMEHELSVRARRFPIHPRPRFPTRFLQITEGAPLLSSKLSSDEARAFRKAWVLIIKTGSNTASKHALTMRRVRPGK